MYSHLPVLLLIGCATEAELQSPNLEAPPFDELAAPELPVEHAPPPGYALQTSELVRGMPFILHVTNADPAHDNRIVSGKPGGPTCPPPLGGACLDLNDPKIRYTGVPAADGTMTVVVNIPPGGSGVPYAIHAVDADVAPAEVSPVVTGTVLGTAPANTQGNAAPFPDDSSHSPNFLLGTAQTVDDAFVITGLAYEGRGSSAAVTLAVYTDNGGTPGDLVVSAEASTTQVGPQVLPVPATPIPPGDYWVMGLFASGASVGIDFSDLSKEVHYISLSYGSPLPDPFPAPSIYTGQDFNYWLVGY